MTTMLIIGWFILIAVSYQGAVIALKKADLL